MTTDIGEIVERQEAVAFVERKLGQKVNAVRGSRVIPALVLRTLLTTIDEMREALKHLLSGHDHLYMAHFGPNADPRDDIAAKPARAALKDVPVGGAQ